MTVSGLQGRGELYVYILYQDFVPFGGTLACDLCIVTDDSRWVLRQEGMDTCLPEVVHLAADMLLSPPPWMPVTACMQVCFQTTFHS